MLQKLIHRFTWRRHYWRNVGFDELSELYTSMMFRSLANSLVGIFIPVYLFQHGYPVWQILNFYGFMFGTSLVLEYVSARLIALYGPKHIILMSYVFQVIAMFGMLSLPIGVPLIAVAVVYGMANVLFFTAFHVDFSKIKHKEHGGKEVGWMYSMEKLGGTLGPLLGGLLAFLFGSQYIFIVAIILLFVGAIPLFLTREPVRTRQDIDFKKLNVEEIPRDLISYGALVLENSICVAVWPLFIGVVVFVDSPYLKLGSVASISIIIALLTARAFGSVVDQKKGRNLLRLGASVNAIVHLFRTFANSYIAVLGLNMVNEGVTVAYRMPFTKGMYDAADDHPGNRIVYIAAMESVGYFVRTIFYFAASLVAFMYSPSRQFFAGLFAVAAVASLIIMLERFRALDR